MSGKSGSRLLIGAAEFQRHFIPKRRLHFLQNSGTFVIIIKDSGMEDCRRNRHFEISNCDSAVLISDWTPILIKRLRVHRSTDLVKINFQMRLRLIDVVY